MMNLNAEFVLQQVIQIIGQICKVRSDQGLRPHTIGRIKNRFTHPDTQAHLDCVSKMFSNYSDDCLVIIDKGGYIAVIY
ncbi:MAG: hypothetical protein WD512_20940, partial [Candidatus Paceibacterota bacterium]